MWYVECVVNAWFCFLQVARESELVGELEELGSLEKEYAQDDTVYQAKIQV